MFFPDGSRVVVVELKSSPQYNGARADVLHYDKDRERYAVRLVHPSFDGKELLCRAASLELVYALLPRSLAEAQSVLAGGGGRTAARLAFEDCSALWGPAVGRALVAKSAFRDGELLFSEAPFLIVSNPPGLEKWVRRWDCFFAATRRAQAGSRDILDAFEASDSGGDAVVESLLADGRDTLEQIWSASGADPAVRQSAMAGGHFEREARRVATVLARWQTNQHELGSDSRRGLYWLAPKVAHSCGPNVGWEDPDPTTGRVELRALRSIAAGEVLGVNYMAEGFLRLPVERRRAQLLAERKFLCVCERCRAEAALRPVGLAGEEEPEAAPEPVQGTDVPAAAAAGGLDEMD